MTGALSAWRLAAPQRAQARAVARAALELDFATDAGGVAVRVLHPLTRRVVGAVELAPHPRLLCLDPCYKLGLVAVFRGAGLR